MSITINLSLEAERKLQERATRSGQTVEGFVQKLLERELLGVNGGQEAGSPDQGAGTTLDEVLAPVREEFEKSGMTEDELAALVEEVREEIWQEQQARKAP